MSLEEALAANTAAIKEQTAFLKSLQGKGGAAPATEKAPVEKAPVEKAPVEKAAGSRTAAKKITIDTIKEKFGAFLGVEDKKLRAKRIEQATAINEHFGVVRASLLEEDQWAEALGYLKAFEAGETPSFMSEEDAGDGDDDDDGALV